jgi:hypothetical protein
METEQERNHLSGKALAAYDRMLERVQARLSEMEETTRDTLEEEVEKAVAFEYELAEMTREEADLLGAFLQRDLEHLLHFVEETGEGVREWLQLDISLLEHQLANMLFSVADKTRIDTLELNQKLQSHGPSQYISGEVATAGMFKCLNCGHMRCLTATSHLEPCDACDSHYYERVTSRWPRRSD